MVVWCFEAVVHEPQLHWKRSRSHGVSIVFLEQAQWRFTRHFCLLPDNLLISGTFTNCKNLLVWRHSELGNTNSHLTCPALRTCGGGALQDAPVKDCTCACCTGEGCAPDTYGLFAAGSAATCIPDACRSAFSFCLDAGSHSEPSTVLAHYGSGMLIQEDACTGVLCD